MVAHSLHVRLRVAMLLLGYLAWTAGCVASPTPASPASPLSDSAYTPSATPSSSPTPPPTATQRSTPTVLPTVPPTATPPPTQTPTPRPTPPPTPTPAPTIAVIPLGDLQSYSGQTVIVEGTVLWVSSFAKGFRFLLEDGTGRATLLLWGNTYDGCPDQEALMEGAHLRIHGTVARYRDEWQIEPTSCREVEILAAGALPPERAIGSISPADRATRATVLGLVVRVEPFSAGQRLLLQDPTGQIPVLLWNSVLERIAEASRLLQAGARIRVSGVIDQYRGQMELIPQLPVHVAALE